MNSLIVFGRQACTGCQELRRQLELSGIRHTYHSLDYPVSDFKGGENVPIAERNASIAEWSEARTALVEARVYQLKDNAPLPVVLLVWADPCDDTDAFCHINVLDNLGQVDIELLPNLQQLNSSGLLNS